MSTETDSRPQLLLIDGHSLAYRAFYALPVENFSTSTGQPTNAVYGFTSMMINALRDEKPTHLCVAFDVSRKTFRTELFPDYKANRAKSPDEFKGQVELIRDVLTAMNVVNVSVENYEADDIIATLTKEAESDGLEVMILTGDRDSFQLVDDQTTVLYPRKGTSDIARMGPEAIKEKYGLSPNQYPDFAALRGDPSDNLPGIPGVGEKTATKWINQFGDLDGLLSNAGEVKGKVGEALRDHLDQVKSNRQLTELVTSVPLEVGVGDLTVEPIDRERVEEVFDSLQFRVLRDRLFKELGIEAGSDSSSTEGSSADLEVPEDQLTIAGEGTTVKQWLATHATKGTRLAIAVEGTWGSGTGEIWSLALYAPSGALWLKPEHLKSDDLKAFLTWLGDERSKKAMHAAKGPMLAFLTEGWVLKGLDQDIELSAYLVLAGQRSFKLGDLAERYLGATLEISQQKEQSLFDDEESSETAAALAKQAKAIWELGEVLDKQVEEKGGAKLLHELELPVQRVLADMEHAGIAVDKDLLTTTLASYELRIAETEQEAVELVGHGFNLGSPKQLQEILFTERGLPTTKKIKSGFTTDAEALAWLADVSNDPLPEVILKWRDVTKLKQTVAGLLPLIAGDGRVHTTFQQTVAATGRLSSADPNLQNIPIRTEDGRKIRSAFVVGEDYSELLTADYAQIELRLMAELSQDEALIEAFRSGEDLHTTMASAVFGVEAGEVDAEHRRKIKAMSYGLAYGLSNFGLSQQLGVSAKEASSLMDSYFGRFGRIRDYLDDVVAQARDRGYTETMWGRRRYLPDLNSDNRQRREIAERMALNAPIQGSAADLVKVAMLNVEKLLSDNNLKSRLLLQVHDELVLEVGPGELDQVRELTIEGMTNVIELNVPLEVSVGVGSNWQEAGH
ncbi:MAG: DNA polymerase I [Candidatus Nanopelagicales bacterium]